MNKEQQIEEIEQFIYDYVDSKQTKKIYLFSSRVNKLAKPFVHNKGIAEALYKAGYRKVSEIEAEKNFTFKTTQGNKYSVFNSVRKEFAEKVKEYINDKVMEDFDDSDSVKYYTIDLDEFESKLDELLEEYLNG